MKALEIPRSEDKVGLKIDYLAKRLALVLAPHGFKRKGRMLLAQAGEGQEQHWRMVHLQAGQWNEGPRGEFYVNLVLQFPALIRLRAQSPGSEWLLDYVDKPDAAAGNVAERLEGLVASLPEGNPHGGLKMKIGRDTDLAQRADTLDAAVLGVGLPWLQAHGCLRALADYSDSLIACDVPTRIGAAVLLGDRDAAQAVLASRAAHFANWTAPGLKTLRTWLESLGLDVSALPTEPAPRQPSRFEAKRLEEERAEAAAAEAKAAAARAKIEEGAPDAVVLAEAWVAERRARWRSDPAPLVDLPTGARVAGMGAAEREAVLLALLQQLVAAESTARRNPLRPDPKEFELDEDVRAIVEVLLPTIETPLESTHLGVLGTMRALTGRIDQDLVTGRYPWPFVALVKWIDRTGTARRAQLRPAVRALLEQFAQVAVQRHSETTAALDAETAKPIDPANPMADFLLEARERTAEILVQVPPVDMADVLRRLSEYPEQILASEDKRAFRNLRRFVLRDDHTHGLPVALDADDWGGPAQAAWNAAPQALRAALAPVLQGWMEGVDSKPSQKWLRALDGQIAALDAGLAAPWRDWIVQRLRAFEQCSGRTEWATTGARPGVGARLGESSEALLAGMLWWAWRDPVFPADVLAEALSRLADAAWLKLPEVGARAPVIGGLVLRMLAGLGGECLGRVAELAKAKGAKQLKQAAERALADPLARR